MNIYWTSAKGVCRERRPSDRVTGELLEGWEEVSIGWCHQPCHWRRLGRDGGTRIHMRTTEGERSAWRNRRVRQALSNDGHGCIPSAAQRKTEERVEQERREQGKKGEAWADVAGLTGAWIWRHRGPWCAAWEAGRQWNGGERPDLASGWG